MVGHFKSLQNGEAQLLHYREFSYKMALVQMDPSKEGSLYKMVRHDPNFRTPKIHKMVSL